MLATGHYRRGCLRWAATHASRFEPSKFRLIHFHPPGRGDQDQGASTEPGPPGSGPGETLDLDDGQVVETSTTARLLGVILDQHLTFEAHLKHIDSTATRWLQAIINDHYDIHCIAYPEAIQIYTDGSGIRGRVGIAMAEIYSDKQGALRTPLAPKQASGQYLVRELVDLLDRLNPVLDISFHCVVAQMRTGKIGLNHYLSTINWADDPLCPCERAPEMIHHVLFGCTQYDDLQHTVWTEGTPRNLTEALAERNRSHPAGMARAERPQERTASDSPSRRWLTDRYHILSHTTSHSHRYGAAACGPDPRSGAASGCRSLGRLRSATAPPEPSQA
ncbi:hypothetical protein CNMCM7691_006685 [Aspergillus felis]|uniref:Uncharacterized protein n=1 Tax=Aspergillus felis TaxID=1287682 RepID=A0A8H6R2Q1_9EURO|nr:hypothetical protein CNMCM7691_006685 [Aspergillus felis]